MSSIVETKSLGVGYGKRVIVGNVNLSIDPGKIYTLIGPNGSGKTTVLKTILGQIGILEGEISLVGKHIGELSGNEIAKLMSMVTTKRPNTELMTCRDVVATGRYPFTGRFGILSKEDWEKVDWAIDFVGAGDTIDCDFQKISDGQKQRIMIARAICQEPKVLVLDEPTSFLDIKYKLEILECIYKLSRDNNTAIIMSLHELDLARSISDVIICVENDHIGRVGSAKEIYSDGYIQKLYGIDKDYFDEERGIVVPKLWVKE